MLTLLSRRTPQAVLGPQQLPKRRGPCSAVAQLPRWLALEAFLPPHMPIGSRWAGAEGKAALTYDLGHH